PLATGELGGIAVGQPLQLHQVEQLMYPLGDLALVPLADLQPEADVLEHGHVLEGGVVLEDEADFALLRWRLRDIAALDQRPAGVERLQPGNRPQQRRLAGAAGPEQGGKGPVRDLDRYVFQCLKVTEALVGSLD